MIKFKSDEHREYYLGMLKETNKKGAIKDSEHEEKDMKAKKRKEIVISIVIGFFGLLLVGSLMGITCIRLFANHAWENQHEGIITAITVILIASVIVMIPIMIYECVDAIADAYRAHKEKKSKNTETEANVMEVFKDLEHAKFFFEMKEITGQTDVYHRALFYTIGICRETRDHYRRIYDVENREIRTECLKEGWQTHGTRKVCLLAFNLWNGYVSEEDPRASSPEDLFASSSAPYFIEALRIRYPKYLGDEKDE